MADKEELESLDLYCGGLSFSYTDCILHSREALTWWFCANCLAESGRHQMERKGKSVTLLVGKYIFSHRYIGQKIVLQCQDSLILMK